jgi:hypothetical protein
MKRILIPVIALAIVLASGTAWAADATAALDLNSAYIWRGITVNDGLVAQPSMNVAKSGLNFNVWGNFDLSDYDGAVDKNNFSEVDLTLSYAHTFNQLTVGAGVIEYLFPATPTTNLNGTREVYASLSHPIIGGLSAGLNVYYDVDELHGYYSDLSLTYGMDLAENLSLSASGKVAYASKEWAVGYGGEEAGWHDYNLRLALTYAVSEALSLGANINYADTMDTKALPDALAKTNLYGGVNVSYSF